MALWIIQSVLDYLGRWNRGSCRYTRFIGWWTRILTPPLTEMPMYLDLTDLKDSGKAYRAIRDYSAADPGFGILQLQTLRCQEMEVQLALGLRDGFGGVSRSQRAKKLSFNIALTPYSLLRFYRTACLTGNASSLLEDVKNRCWLESSAGLVQSVSMCLPLVCICTISTS